MKAKAESMKALFLVTSMVMSFTTLAQFNGDKYKNDSRFRPGASPRNNNQNANSNSNFVDSESNQETFGNRTPAPKAEKNLFVNLNPETAFGPEIVEPKDYVDKDIMEITREIQELTGINLILDKDVKGKVSISFSTPITVGDFWKAYLTSLDMAGFTLVKSGAFYKVINTRDVRYSPTKIYTGSYTPETDAHVMKVMALKHVDAAEISRNFRPFMSRYGRIIDLKQTNTIIISDTGTNINRLEKLIKFLDVPGYEESLQIIPVKNSSASEIAKLLDEILRGGSGGSSRGARPAVRSKSKRFTGGGGSDGQNISKIIAEPRTNSIIAMANATGAEELRNLIKKLDISGTSSNSNKIHVLYLNYGNAEELAKTLSNLVSGSARQNNTGRNARSFVSRDQGSTLFNGEVKINADKNNNALVVTASATDWITIKSVIEKLDIPRDQVYVEGIIMETSLNKTRSFGVETIAKYGRGNAQVGGFNNGQGLGDLLGSGNPANISNFFVGIGGPNKNPQTVTIGGQELQINSVNALIRAIASNTATNVLATPQLLAMDNTEAEFEVGATVPILEAQVDPNGQTRNTIRQQEAKLSLKITPQINKVTRFVTLKINQSINDFLGDPTAATGNGLATTVRSANTEVTAKDGDTIAMGGLLRDVERTSFNKVPLLGDIPVLGWLFKSKNKTVEKINLLFFLTPRIISPYEKTASKNTNRVLDERLKSMKEVIDDENPDPFEKETAELRAKIEDQELRSQSGPTIYQKSNEEDSGIGPSSSNDIPDYQGIAEEVERNGAQ